MKTGFGGGNSSSSRSFTLTDPGCSGLGCRVSSGGNAGVYSDTVGVLLHPEIQDIIADKKLTPTLDRTGAARTSAQAVWAQAERQARRARDRSSSRH